MILASISMLTGLGGLALGGYALTRARETTNDSQALADRAAAAGASGVDPRAVRDVAVLHYDALEEMSGARSFSLAMLNTDGDGVVITSINGRTETRTYAKAITRGDAETLLSPEEYRVIRSARLGNGVGAQASATMPVPSPTPTGGTAPGGDVSDSVRDGMGEETGQRVTVLAGDGGAEDDTHVKADGETGEDLDREAAGVGAANGKVANGKVAGVEDLDREIVGVGAADGGGANGKVANGKAAGIDDTAHEGSDVDDLSIAVTMTEGDGADGFAKDRRGARRRTPVPDVTAPRGGQPV